jgi:hypothetical protein
MLVPYLGNLTSSKDDIMNDITDIEREKLKEFNSLRDMYIEKSLKLIDRKEPSIVLDDFLFLGNLQHAKNREVLERLQISKIFF